ncbi:hypothetical protein KP509_15G015900 [Ceratopteris richardii]|uniref:Uncharacterized protein n=1 Tax=Ceratopteris richardii TaxID=49495 RepID=A0A8T2T4Z8_CERRI|nr:hypothetical protein KP509_15G015900 [Ceratopteris richardii]
MLPLLPSPLEPSRPTERGPPHCEGDERRTREEPSPPRGRAGVSPKTPKPNAHSKPTPPPSTEKKILCVNDINYLMWLTRVIVLLKRADLWDIVSGTTPKPPANDPQLADWIAKDLQAQADLLLYLGDRQVQIVWRATTGAEIWTTLRTNYHHEGLTTQVTTLKRLLSASLSEQQSTHLQSMLLLTALPQFWHPFITTEASVVGLTNDKLIARILQEDTMRQNTRSSHSSILPLSTQAARHSTQFPKHFGRSNVQPKPVDKQHKITHCSYYGHPGHLEKECRMKRPVSQRHHQ